MSLDDLWEGLRKLLEPQEGGTMPAQRQMGATPATNRFQNPFMGGQFPSGGMGFMPGGLSPGALGAPLPQRPLTGRPVGNPAQFQPPAALAQAAGAAGGAATPRMPVAAPTAGAAAAQGAGGQMPDQALQQAMEAQQRRAMLMQLIQALLAQRGMGGAAMAGGAPYQFGQQVGGMYG